MRVVSADSIGWEHGRTARARCVVNPGRAEELVWLTITEGRPGEPVALMVRPRIPTARWHVPGPGERLEVLAWTPTEATVDDLELSVTLGLDVEWQPSASASVRVLWVEG